MGRSSWTEFARIVDEVRVRNHQSIGQFARVAGVPKATAQGWLNGRHMPTPALRRRFLQAVAELGLDGAAPEGLWGELVE